MVERIIGTVRRVVGPVVEAGNVSGVEMLELVYVGEERLVGEIVRIRGDAAWIQVYEDTTGLRPGAPVIGQGEPLSVELGPGLLGSIYDGVQRPLDVLRAQMGDFVSKGVHAPALSREKCWGFTPSLKPPCSVSGGTVLGVVKETEVIEHRVMTPPSVQGELVRLAEPGEYRIEDSLATVRTAAGDVELRFFHKWPVRKGRPYARRLPYATPLITGQRVLDTLFPVARGGVVVVPGGFGTGKTMVQHAIAKWCDADLVVYIGCGERGNEMTGVLKEFPELIDPRTGKSLMERTLLIANTSNMPVAAREASIYTGITIAEYYRDMGYDVAIMADSTSRWAEALRELSGRMEEMPADEGFPAYLPTRLAEFYERAGPVTTLGGHKGSITTIGAVSPPGGDFSEPVTQHTKRFIRAFWALDKQLANARHFPAVSWLESYSEYIEDVAPWWDEKTHEEWREVRSAIMAVMQKEARLEHVVKLVGADVLPDSQRLVLDVANMFKNAFLQQSAFDKVDAFCVAEKQFMMLNIIVTFYNLAAEAIQKGVTLASLKKMEAVRDIMQMKYECPNDELDRLASLLKEVEESIHELTSIYG
ncbi:MAG TPA: V-type ATP synthase subunit A [Candidatus Hydrogenedentes bacterium]|nr:V-type ATP synthase subunit A [Candidatus Hydrogenedentota bacterium]HQH51859.1 V-type ATP synthase subunit A [Candidatus Hydrogenedentota bacterium]